MEPKTKEHHKVVSMYKQLPDLTPEQSSWAYEKCLGKFATFSRNRIYCMECGHKYQGSMQLWQEQVIGLECPECKNKLERLDYKTTLYQDDNEFSVFTTHKGYQVIRIFYIKKWMKRKQPVDWYTEEVAQFWISPEGKLTMIGKYPSGYGTWAGSRHWVGDFSIKKPWPCVTEHVAPGRKILPSIRRNGFKGSYHGIAPQQLWSKLLQSNLAETLMKTGQIKLLQMHCRNARRDDPVTKYWPSIKIFLRHRGSLPDYLDIWLDYVQLLDYFGKDLRSMKWLWPENLHKAHNKLVERKRKIQIEQEKEMKARKLQEQEAVYAKLRGHFFGFLITDGALEIRAMESVQQVKEEGDILKHCVYVNDYYAKKNSLLLSARWEGQVIETIEVCLVSNKVLQARGRYNKYTEHNKRICQLVEEHMPAIAAIHKRRKQKNAKPKRVPKPQQIPA